MRWSWKHERVAEWRHAFEQLALDAQLPELEAATVSCRARLGKGGRRYDAENDYYALKPPSTASWTLACCPTTAPTTCTLSPSRRP